MGQQEKQGVVEVTTPGFSWRVRIMLREGLEFLQVFQQPVPESIIIIIFIH